MKPGSSEPPTMRAVIPVTLAGMRSDQALAWVFPEYSRTTLKSWILAGRVQVDGRCVEPRHVVSGGEAVELAPPPPSATLSIFGREHPEAIPIEVIHEDPEILVVNKPAGLVVHPGAGNREGTMLNALLHLDPGLAALPINKVLTNPQNSIKVCRSHPLRANERWSTHSPHPGRSRL